MTRFTVTPDEMIERHLKARDISDARVLAAMRAVPREQFVGPSWAASAYEDHALPIGAGQTISQPYIVALMVQALALGECDHILDVGTGSGYAAAVMAQIAGDVVSLEREAALAADAAERLAQLGYTNVAVQVADGWKGWPDAAPYDAIHVAAAAPAVPESLKQQLATGGRLIIPVKHPSGCQWLKLITRTGADSYTTETLGGVRFVPLVEGMGAS